MRCRYFSILSASSATDFMLIIFHSDLLNRGEKSGWIKIQITHPQQTSQRFLTFESECCGCFIFYVLSAFAHKILRSSCTRSPITIGLDKKPVMPHSKALRRSSSNALAVMARIGSFARAGSSSVRICRVAV